MNWRLLGALLQTVGGVLIAYTALSVHYRFRKEHQIDDHVFSEMRREHIYGIAGIALIIIGFILEVPYLV